jgi:parvulin-like peptidyl-prolyl isomerase
MLTRFGLKRTPHNLLISLFCLIAATAFAFAVRAQPAPEAATTAAAEASIQAKISELKAAKKNLARQARETNGYHESFRQMKIVKIDKMIKRLENGENVPQSKIEHTIGHMPFPLYNPGGD